MKKLTLLVPIILTIEILLTPAYGSTSMFKRGPSEEKAATGSKGTVLAESEKAFLESDYAEVIIIADKYLVRRPDDELQYLAGRALLSLNRFDEARNRFSRIINSSNNEELLDDAYISFADSYYLGGDYKMAQENYEKVIRYFPDSDNMPIVYYRLGECCSKSGDNYASQEYYDKLIKTYPDSLEARILIGKTIDFIPYSVQVGSFKSWQNAKKLYDELKNEGFDANIYTAIVGDSHFYRVRVGKFNKLSDAEDMARTLQNSGYSTKIYP